MKALTVSRIDAAIYAIEILLKDDCDDHEWPHGVSAGLLRAAHEALRHLANKRKARKGEDE